LKLETFDMKLFFLLHLHHFAVLVVAAVGADAVWQDRLLAARAILNLNRLQVVMAPPVALPGTRRAPLGDGHECSPSFVERQRGKRSMVGA
jgi:hypothetical protein